MSNASTSSLPVADPGPEPGSENASASADPVTPGPTRPVDLKVQPIEIKTRRPTELSRTSTTQTQFMSMLLGQHKIPRLHNILASFFTVSNSYIHLYIYIYIYISHAVLIS